MTSVIAAEAKILIAVTLMSLVSAGTLPAQRKAVAIEPLTVLQHAPTKNGYRVDTLTGRMIPFALDGRIDLDCGSSRPRSRADRFGTILS